MASGGSLPAGCKSWRIPDEPRLDAEIAAYYAAAAVDRQRQDGPVPVRAREDEAEAAVALDRRRRPLVRRLAASCLDGAGAEPLEQQPAVRGPRDARYSMAGREQIADGARFPTAPVAPVITMLVMTG